MCNAYTYVSEPVVGRICRSERFAMKLSPIWLVVPFCFQRRGRDLERNDTGYLDVVLHCWCQRQLAGPEMLFPLTVWPGGRQTGNRQAQPDICCFEADKSSALSPELPVPGAVCSWKAATCRRPGRCAGYFFSACLWLSKAAYVRLWVLGEIKLTAFKAF